MVKSQIDISSYTNIEKSSSIAQQFFTVPTSPNPYISYTVNNMDLIITLSNKRKDWMKKYYRIIRGLEIIADIQH